MGHIWHQDWGYICPTKVKLPINTRCVLKTVQNLVVIIFVRDTQYVWYDISHGDGGK